MRPLYLTLCFAAFLSAQTTKQSPADKFRQLEEILLTPNEYRAASGAPGHRNQRCIGSESITYKTLVATRSEHLRTRQ